MHCDSYMMWVGPLQQRDIQYCSRILEIALLHSLEEETATHVAPSNISPSVHTCCRKLNLSFAHNVNTITATDDGRGYRSLVVMTILSCLITPCVLHWPGNVNDIFMRSRPYQPVKITIMESLSPHVSHKINLAPFVQQKQGIHIAAGMKDKSINATHPMTSDLRETVETSIMESVMIISIKTV